MSLDFAEYLLDLTGIPPDYLSDKANGLSALSVNFYITTAARYRLSVRNKFLGCSLLVCILNHSRSVGSDEPFVIPQENQDEPCLLTTNERHST